MANHAAVAYAAASEQVDHVHRLSVSFPSIWADLHHTIPGSSVAKSPVLAIPIGIGFLNVMRYGTNWLPFPTQQ